MSSRRRWRPWPPASWVATGAPRCDRWTPLVPLIHDGFISSLRAYSPSALRALAAHADPAIEIEVRPSRRGVPLRPPPQIVTAHRGG